MSIRTNSENVMRAVAHERMGCIRTLRRLKAEYANDVICGWVVARAIHLIQKRSKKSPKKEPSR